MQQLNHSVQYTIMQLMRSLHGSGHEILGNKIHHKLVVDMLAYIRLGFLAICGTQGIHLHKYLQVKT